MASSSSSFSSSPGTWKYNVFVSFHGPDVRKGFLCHFRKQFNYNGITMFDDQKIVRSHTIAPALTQGIRESSVSIVILSKNYASSSWCLDELLEILECKKAMGQIVMTVFYGVDPSDVRKQTGDFGIAFNKTCAAKTEERKMWAQALTDAANIAGEDSQKWDNEADMIEKIAKDVSDKLHETPSRDFDGMVGLEAHLRQVESLLEFDSVGVKMMVAISGPAGIGKTTIARALHSLHSNRFHLTCFMDNLRESYHSGLDVLRLQKDFLSKALNHDGIRICHSGVIKERLCDQRVLIILDDVNDIKQLEALAGDISWFGPGSRILVTTENKDLLQQHGINNTYHVGFPSNDQALKILCRYAFRHNYPLDGFEKLAEIVTELCGNLPLGLRVVGSSLRGKNEEEWEEVKRRLETILDRDIEKALRVGYESLDENEQSLFLHIAVFFNFEDGDLVKAMLADNNLEIKYGLRILEDKSLIHVSNNGEIEMHKLLQQVGIKTVRREEPWKRRILIDAPDICDVLERAKGSRAVSGISFDISNIKKVSISPRAFTRMPNLRFLKVYKSKDDGNDIVHIPEEMELPSCLRLLCWDAYPSKCLPPTFQPEYLVKLKMEGNKLKKLWGGTQPLPNLKKMDLSWSLNIKELPDLSKAAMLERLVLRGCKSLVEIPASSNGNFEKLKYLDMSFCRKLQVVSTRFKLAPLGFLDMRECSEMRNFPDISTNTRSLVITDTMLEKLPESSNRPLWSRLESLSIYGDGADIEELPDWIKDLPRLTSLQLDGCSNLASLPELPGSLERLMANSCESLETVSLDYEFRIDCSFTNCFNLDQEARRAITQLTWKASLPGRTMPAEFDHRALGTSLTIQSLSLDSQRFRFCIVISPRQQVEEYYSVLLLRRRINKGSPTDEEIIMNLIDIDAEHLFISYTHTVGQDGWLEQDNEIMFEFINTCQELDILECGVQVLTEESERRRRIEFERPAKRLKTLSTRN